MSIESKDDELCFCAEIDGYTVYIREPFKEDSRKIYKFLGKLFSSFVINSFSVDQAIIFQKDWHNIIKDIMKKYDDEINSKFNTYEVKMRFKEEKEEFKSGMGYIHGHCVRNSIILDKPEKVKGSKIAKLITPDKDKRIKLIDEIMGRYIFFYVSCHYLDVSTTGILTPLSAILNVWQKRSGQKT